MKYRVRTAFAAKRDAREYARFIRVERRAPEAARRWMLGLQGAIEELSEAPERFSLVPEATDLGVSLRSFVYLSHRVIFWIDDATRLVTVIRV